MTRYHRGQTVTIEVCRGRRCERLTGTVRNTLPADVFEHSVLVVVPIVSLFDNGPYVGWYSPEQLDQWQAKAA